MKIPQSGNNRNYNAYKNDYENSRKSIEKSGSHKRRDNKNSIGNCKSNGSHAGGYNGEKF
jgi:hypothetical protein